MAEMLRILSRQQINSDAWNACVSDSGQRIIYGYSWYLDAVLPAPSWKWIGLVLTDESGQYRAVMPIPLRQKQIIGVPYEWVVHQPFFCQYLAVFSCDSTLDPTPFFQIMQQRFRYGSIFNIRQQPADFAAFDRLQSLSTQILDLSVDYETIYRNYSHDRRVNLRRALRYNWAVVDSTDPAPLVNLFRENHANTISGGVADWAYATLNNLIYELQQRGLVTLRYAVHNGCIEAGALFVQEGNRIIYLFNAASEIGRRGNARTLLIDQVIRENAGICYVKEPLIFDFESPEKSSIRDFYRSFGAVEEAFWSVHWSRLTLVERMIQRIRNRLKKASVAN